jgi:hypothetical protein
VLAVDPDPSTLGSPWFAMERIDGVGVPDDAMSGYVVDGWLADAVWPSSRSPPSRC